MLEQLQQYIKNKSKKMDLLPCEKILGSEVLVDAFAKFFQDHAAELELIAAIKLHEFEMTQVWDRQELSKFIGGLATLPLFFKECLDEQSVRMARIEEERKLVELEASKLQTGA